MIRRVNRRASHDGMWGTHLGVMTVCGVLIWEIQFRGIIPQCSAGPCPSLYSE